VVKTAADGHDSNNSAHEMFGTYAHGKLEKQAVRIERRELCERRLPRFVVNDDVEPFGQGLFKNTV
jgi:hypothetical protein